MNNYIRNLDFQDSTDRLADSLVDSYVISDEWQRKWIRDDLRAIHKAMMEWREQEDKNLSDTERIMRLLRLYEGLPGAEIKVEKILEKEDTLEASDMSIEELIGEDN